MAIKFPDNPSDGMIFEASVGLFYRFSKNELCWNRIAGLDAIGVATPSADGLMAKEDLTKLNGLMVPPPRTFLTSEDCGFVFSRGVFGFRSSRSDLFIDHELDLVTKNETGGITVDKRNWKIHENTFGHNFRVNADRLIEEMEKRGNLNFLRSMGPQGPAGDIGDPGEAIEAGPVGLKGDQGQSIRFAGVLSEDTSGGFELAGDQNRAVVDIQTEESPEGDLTLVLTRANIGNPDALPSLIRPKRFDSPWVLVLGDEEGLVRTTIVDDCSISINSALLSTPALFYMNMETIVDQIFDRFVELVLELKSAKEKLVNDWLAVMISTFVQQREAVCCALENCISKKRNQDERRYIETSRIRAAAGTFPNKIILEPIGGSASVGGLNTTNVQTYGQEGGKTERAWIDCSECQIEATLDPRLNSGSILNAMNIGLESGDYIIEIEECCISQMPGNKYTGVINLEHASPTGRRIAKPVSFGTFETNEQARNAYLGLRWSFSHTGGPVAIWFPDTFQTDFLTNQENVGFSGSMTVCIKSVDCFELAAVPDTFTLPSDSCEMTASHVRWYEAAWISGSCCGAYVTLAGVQYVVVKVSVGIDRTCGGGESLDTVCISKFMDAGLGHPAVAFPTLDGVEFLGKPKTGVQIFVTDDELSEQLLNEIYSDRAIIEKGNPRREIPFIIFPVFV